MGILLPFAIVIFAYGIILYQHWKRKEVKQIAKRLLHQLAKNPAFANDIAAQMQHRFGFQPNVNMTALQDLVVNISEGNMLSEFEILRKIELSDGAFLFITLYHEKHYSTDKYGKQSIYMENHLLNFRVCKNFEKMYLEVWSDDYNTLSEKNLRQAFARELFQRTALQ